ncbi:MAG: GldG family protein [Proteobacteria bacterium]|nr:GldG family protein [Pseudomonadota bacterium]
MAEFKKRRSLLGPTLISVGLVLVILVAINVIASNFFFRVDVTEERLYTLSQGTEKIVRAVKTPVTIKYYFNKGSSQIPLLYKNYGKKIEELLQEYQNLNPEMITVELYDPAPDSDEEEWAKKYGLTGIDLGTESFTMGLVTVQEDKEKNIPFLDIRREKFLEYDITQLILQVSQEKESTIGIMSSLPVLGQEPNQMQQMQGQQAQPKWFFVQELEKFFEIEEVKSDAAEIGDDISILMVIHPKNLSELTQYAIDQFVLRGGQLVLLVDPSARVDPSAAMAARMGQQAQVNSDLKKLFEHWGVNYESKALVGDAVHGTPVQTQKGTVNFFFWHSLTKSSFNQELIATKELENMLLVEPGGFTIDEKSPFTLNSLIHSSDRAGKIDSFLMRYAGPNDLNKKIKPDGTTYNFAGILNGELTSAFEKRPVKKDEDGKEQKFEGKPHMVKSQGKAKVLLITDVDFLADQFTVDKFQLLGQVLSQPKNDNMAFFVNMVEFLGGADEMMQIRSRGRFSRPFTRFKELERRAQTQYREAEASITEKLKEVQQKLSQLNVKQGTNQISLTKEQITKIQQFRNEEKKTQTELREIRKLLRQDIDFEKNVLTLLNLLVVPILFIIFGGVLYFRRFQR